MNHKDFIEKYNSGEITVNIDINKAGYMYAQSDMPKELKRKQAIIRAFAFGGVILGFVLFFYVQWWIALGILIMALSIFPKAQKVAGNDVLQASLDNPNVYQVAIDNQVLIISNKMTKEEISDVQTKGVKLLESIEEEMKDKEIGYRTKFKTFEGNYIYYYQFFQTLSNFRDYNNDSYMCTLNTKEMIIGLTIGKVESRNLLYISAEKLKINT